jgi:hypothetical protein
VRGKPLKIPRNNTHKPKKFPRNLEKWRKEAGKIYTNKPKKRRKFFHCEIFTQPALLRAWYQLLKFYNDHEIKVKIRG